MKHPHGQCSQCERVGFLTRGMCWKHYAQARKGTPPLMWVRPAPYTPAMWERDLAKLNAEPMDGFAAGIDWFRQVLEARVRP